MTINPKLFPTVRIPDPPPPPTKPAKKPRCLRCNAKLNDPEWYAVFGLCEDCDRGEYSATPF